MRTTVTLDDRLLERLKKRAAESGTSVSKVVERAVRLLLRSPAPQQPERFDLVTFGEGGRFAPLNIAKTAALMEADDIDRFWAAALTAMAAPSTEKKSSSTTRVEPVTARAVIKSVIPMAVNGGKMRTKGGQRRRKGFIGFSRNLLISFDYGQLQQVLMKLVAWLLTEGLLVRI